MEVIAAAVSGAVVTVTAVVAIATLGLKLSATNRELADVRVADEHKAGQLAIAEAGIKHATARAELAEKRLRDADALVDEMARDMPSDGAFERLLRAYSRARSVDGAGGSVASGTVFVESATKPAGSDDLLKPGDES